MERYISKYASTLSSTQKKKLTSLLGTDAIIPEGMVFDGSPITTAPALGERLRSVEYNELMNSILVDLTAVYVENNKSNQRISRFEMYNKDRIAVARTALKRIRSQLSALNSILDGSASYAINENFSDRSRLMFSGTMIDGDGALVLSPTNTEIFNSSYEIVSATKTVSPASAQSDLLYQADMDVAFNYDSTSNIYDTVSGEYSPATMLTRGTGGTWRDKYLVDEPVVQYIDDNKVDGLIVKLNLKFSSGKDINTIVIDPVSIKDLGIMKIRWKNSAGVWGTMTNYDKGTTSISSTTMIALRNIRDVFGATEIEIWFLQRNYTHVKRIVDGNREFEERIWNEFLAREYDRIASKYSPAAITTAVTKKDNKVRKTTTYESSLNEIIQSNVPEDAVKMAMNLMKRDPVELNRVEYVLGAYSIEPTLRTYPGGNTERFLLSHDGDEGYTGEAASITEVELAANMELPDQCAVHFYLMDVEGRKEMPVVPRGTVEWVEHISPSGYQDIEFETMFPCESGSLSVYRNGVGISPTVTQTESVGVRGSYIVAEDVYALKEDVFSVRYRINYENRSISTQRRASVIDLRQELNPIAVYDSTRENTIASVAKNVVTLSRYPYITGGACTINTQTFPFTPESFDYALFNEYFTEPSPRDQRYLPEGFIKYLKILDNPNPAAKWILYSINTDDRTLRLRSLDEAGSILVATWEEEDTVDTEVDLVFGTDTVGSIRADWDVLSEWSTKDHYNVYWQTELFDPPNLKAAFDWAYGKGAVIRQEVMAGVLSGENLNDPSATLEGYFLANTCPILVAVDDRIATDKTSYTQPYQDPLEPYAGVEGTGEYQFFLSGNKIFMNIDFDEFQGRQIDVHYWVLTKGLKMKTVLWSNRKSASHFTPVVKDYTLKFRSR